MHYFKGSSGEVFCTESPEYYTDRERYTPVSKKAGAAAMAEDARKTLRRMLPPGATVYTRCDHVSRSGMFRKIALFAVVKGDLVNVSGLAATATGMACDRDSFALKIGGCGMDMGFHAVYCLSSALYRGRYRCNGVREGKRACCSNDHSNDRGEARAAGYKKGREHSDGGYALRHRWI